MAQGLEIQLLVVAVHICERLTFEPRARKCPGPRDNRLHLSIGRDTKRRKGAVRGSASRFPTVTALRPYLRAFKEIGWDVRD